MSVEFQDYYKILGVARGAEQEEIQKAYRKQARKYHPDVNKEKGAEDQFKKVSEAYEVLKNPETRKKYDALGQNWKAGDHFTPPSGWQNVHFNFDQEHSGGGFSNFFDMIFGQAFGGSSSAGPGSRGARSMARDGQDQESEIEISLEEAVSGAQKEIIFEGVRGSTHAGKRLQVKIPPGSVEGTRIRLAGQGGKGQMGGRDGDLFLLVKIKPHPIFKVMGHDLRAKLDLAPWEAVLGAKVQVPTLGGHVNLKVAPGSQGGSVLRLKGKGLPLRKGGFGDLHIELNIVVPTTPSERENELFEALAKESTFKPRPG
jgi:curved DNA-binding protein